MKVIEGQISIFSYLEELNTTEPEEKPFCWDDDVNEIHRRICELASGYQLLVKNAEFNIWEHVPNLGFRMWLTMEVTREVVKDQNFSDAIDEIVEYAKNKKVELSVMWQACFFFEGEETASLYLTTMFMDKARMKRKR